jgi:P4 family phage/plasmid primase-like protien
MKSVLDAALTYIRQGFYPIPVPYQEKAPCLKAWPKLRLTAETAHAYFNGQPQNIGTLLGIGGLCDLDLDCPESRRAGSVLLPETGAIYGRPSAPYSHMLYRVDGELRSLEYADPLLDSQSERAMLLEVRSLKADGTVGFQSLLPPSVHDKTGEPYQWANDSTQIPANVDVGDIRTDARKTAAAALLGRHFAKEGTRHPAFLALAGILARAGWTEADSLRFHQALYRVLWPGEAELPQRKSEVQTTFAKYKQNPEPPISGIPRLKQLIDPRVVDKALEWLEISGTQRSSKELPSEMEESLSVCGYLCNETGNANRLRDAYGDILAYCPERNGFYVYKNGRWLFSDLAVEKLAEKTMLAAYKDAAQIEDSNQRKAFLRFVDKSLSRNSLSNLVYLARKKVHEVKQEDFDAIDHLLNCRNVTVNLATMQAQAHSKDDLCSKQIPFDYEPNAPCAVFLRFLNRIQTPEIVRYLQKAFGSAAHGKAEKVVFVFYGATGDNGKTTLLEIIRLALGDKEYAGQIKIESLMMRQNESTNAVDSDMADLKGCRFVSSSEVAQGQRLSLNRVKYITGRTQIKARRMRENPFTFNPHHKTFFDCNHRPVITDPDDPVWNRIKCVPFSVQIPRDERDTDLLDKMKAELPGILAWIVRGTKLYLEEGLSDKLPDQIEAATDQYRKDSDRLGDFFLEICHFSVTEKGVWFGQTALYQEYLRWAENNSEKYPVPKDQFEKQLESRGCKKALRDDGTVRAWSGVTLRSLYEQKK